MSQQLQLDLKSPGSPFQMFLKYSPDALNHLFNRCLNLLQERQIQRQPVPQEKYNVFVVFFSPEVTRCMMKPVDLQLQGRLFFDLFLFAPCHITGCELGAYFSLHVNLHLYLHLYLYLYFLQALLGLFWTQKRNDFFCIQHLTSSCR